MRTRMRFVVPQLAAAVVAVGALQGRTALAIDCPPRVHADPAPNEICGRAHYDSAATAQRCAYTDAVARMTPDERDECGIGASANHAAPGDVHLEKDQRRAPQVHGESRTAPDGVPQNDDGLAGDVNPYGTHVATASSGAYVRNYSGKAAAVALRRARHRAERGPDV